MDRHKVSKTARRLFKAMYAQGKLLGDDFDEECIHEFRVAFKRLRAFLRLYSACHKKDVIKMPHDIRRMYAVAGHMREAQLMLQYVAGHNLPFPRCINILNRSLEYHQSVWREEFDKSVLKEFKAYLADHDFRSLPANAMSVLHASQLDKLLGIAIAPVLSDNDVHNIRKHLKDLLYAAGQWDDVSIVNDTVLNQLANETGQYNDRRLLLDKLLSLSSGAGNTEQHEVISFCDAEMAKLAMLKKEIHATARQLGGAA